MYTIRKIKCHVKMSYLMVALIVCVTGCSEPQGELFPGLEQPLVWPQPPESPRIEYLGQFVTEDDLLRSVSSLESMKQALFGREEIGVLVGPYAVVLDANERLYVSDTGGAVIHIMDLQTRNYLQFSELNEGERLICPVGLCIGEQLLYVADSTLSKICVFDMEGNFQFYIGEDLLIRPSGMAFAADEQKLYVADAAQHTIFVFDRQGRHLSNIGSRGAGPGEFNFPTHLWLDKMGQLYISDTLNYRIQILTSQGEFLRMFGQQGDRPGYFAHPCGVASDSHGNIYVTDKQFENVQIFSPEGDILFVFGGEGVNPGQFWLPAGIFIDESNKIFVADQYNKRVQVFQLLESLKQ